MTNKLLTFELTKDGSLEIHGNQKGLEDLINIIQQSIDHKDHMHLMTKSWGGEELTDALQGEENKLIHHVKTFMWT